MEDCGKHVSIKNALKVHRQRKHQRAAQGPGLESQTYLSIKKSSLVLMENFTLVSLLFALLSLDVHQSTSIVCLTAYL